MTSNDSPADRALEGMSERRKTAAFVTVITALVLEVGDSTIVNTALPAIRDGLGANSAEMQWIVAGYLLSLGSLLLLGGRLGDAFGYSRVFMCGVAGFVIASVFCGLSQSPTQLVVARMLQGVAGAIMAPQTMAIVQVLYTPLERVTKLAYFGIIVGLAAILGPIVGGILIELDVFGLGWRAVFLINLPVGLAAIAAGFVVLPRLRGGSALQVDPAGAAIFATGFAAVLYGLIQGSENGWGAMPLVLIVLGFALALFGWRRARRRRRADRPAIIEPALFDVATFRWGVIASLGFSSASIGFLLVVAVALQEGLGLTPLQTGLVHIPFSAGVMLGLGLLVPRLLPLIGKRLPLGGGALMIAATVSVLLLIRSGDSGSVWLIFAFAAAGVGMGTLSGPLGPIVLARVERKDAGTASATFRTAQQLGGAFGVAIVGAAYFSVVMADAAGTRLAGLGPAAAVVATLLALSVIAVGRLPRDLFGEKPGQNAPGGDELTSH